MAANNPEARMEQKLYRYEGESILVTYDAKRCIHAAKCVHALPKVFDPKQRPWIHPDAGSAEEVAATVEACPTGALQYQRPDGPNETPTAENTVQIVPNGPLYVRGEIEAVDGEGNALFSDTRVAFCRCGESKNKPFCDGAHTKAGFRAGSAIPNPKIRQGDTSVTALRVVVGTNGPLILDGPVTVRGAADDETCAGTKTALCRCGASENKPFCDGSHAGAGFTG